MDEIEVLEPRTAPKWHYKCRGNNQNLAQKRFTLLSLKVGIVI